MQLWQRLGLTIVAIVVASIIISIIWNKLFGFGLPSYLGGVMFGSSCGEWGHGSNRPKSKSARHSLFPCGFMTPKNGVRAADSI